MGKSTVLRLLVWLVAAGLAMSALAACGNETTTESDAGDTTASTADETTSSTTSTTMTTNDDDADTDSTGDSDTSSTSGGSDSGGDSQTSSTTEGADTGTTSTSEAGGTGGGSDADFDPGLQPLVDQAKADLADRLGDDAEIIVVSAEIVQWPDAANGCPQPGMRYAQVLSDGTEIVLGAGGVEYRYTTGGTNYSPELCTN